MEEQRKLDAIVRDLTQKVANLSLQINSEVSSHLAHRRSIAQGNMPVEFEGFAGLRSPSRVQPNREINFDSDSSTE